MKDFFILVFLPVASLVLLYLCIKDSYVRWKERRAFNKRMYELGRKAMSESLNNRSGNSKK